MLRLTLGIINFKGDIYAACVHVYPNAIVYCAAGNKSKKVPPQRSPALQRPITSHIFPSARPNSGSLGGTCVWCVLVAMSRRNELFPEVIYREGGTFLVTISNVR